MPTLRALHRAGLTQTVRRHPRIEMTPPLASYLDFVRALALARFVLTDGGSVQEEASYLGKPCLWQALPSVTRRDGAYPRPG
jgi:UDP-N-acetylglucosamine 2-epimerase (non-hydrolysing)